MTWLEAQDGIPLTKPERDNLGTGVGRNDGPRSQLVVLALVLVLSSVWLMSAVQIAVKP